MRLAVLARIWPSVPVYGTWPSHRSAASSGAGYREPSGGAVLDPLYDAMCPAPGTAHKPRLTPAQAGVE